MNPRIILIFFFTLTSCRNQEHSCTDPMANNFDSSAVENDGSCTYVSTTISPIASYSISEEISQTSGLIFWDGLIWTHNDRIDTTLFGIDPGSAEIEKKYTLEDVENFEWEEISQDEDYIYLGDFGNNNSGYRTDLHLLRVGKNSLLEGRANIDTIWFSYSDQTDFTPKENGLTDFDCEAFVVSVDSIYLFTKQWISAQTSVYVLPKTPGSYVARKKETWDIQGLVTGASYIESEGIIILCGYTTLVQPFFYFLYDFNGYDFFSGNKRKVNISLPFSQVEGIATSDGRRYYVSNEHLSVQGINSPPMLHVFDLSELLPK